MLGFVASALSILAVGQVHPQSPPASSECKCARAFRTDPDSLDHALLAYTKALTKGDRAAITKYSARFTMGPNRRRTYRPHVKQEQIIDEMIKRAIRAFHFCGHSTSTVELAYPPSRRLHILAGCIQYDEGVRQRVAIVSVLGYRERGQWVFSPIMAPEDPLQPTLRETKQAQEVVSPPVKNPALRQELLRRVEQDQAIRKELISKGSANPDKATLERMQAIDLDNSKRVRAIVRKHGWPSPELVGRDGAEAAFLIVQHGDLALQKEMLPLVEKAYRTGGLMGQSYALLLDRVLVGEGKPQIYGTQAKRFEDWKGQEPVLEPIEDEANVDKRRAEVGLFPLSEYREMLKKFYFPQDKSKP